MTLEEYITRFRLLQHAAEKEERNLALLSSGAYSSFLNRFSGTTDPILESVVVTRERMQKSFEKKQRLCERYAVRLTRAISMIEIPYLREYALCHFLYGLTHEEIAEQSFFCVRTVYRHGKKAKKELEKALLSIQPKRIRTVGARFTVKGKLPRKEKTHDSISRSVAFSAARRYSEPYRPKVVFA